MSFPEADYEGQLHTIGNTEWRWDGEKWVIEGSGTSIKDVYTDEVGLVKDARFVQDLYARVLETIATPVLSDQEDVNIAFTEIIENLKDVVTSPNVILENDNLIIGSLYQKVLETPTPPPIGDQETANIAFAEIIDNLKAGGATVIISDTPPGRDPYADPYDPYDPYGGYEGLETGDLWVDSTDFDMYVWEGDAWVEVGNSASGIANAIVSENPPTDPASGFLWFNTLNANLYVYTGEEWVETGAAGRVSPTPYGSGGGGSVDLTNYATKSYVDKEVSDLQQMINVNTNDIADIYAADYATEKYVDDIVDVQNEQINEIADDVAALKANGTGDGSGGGGDLSSYATKTYVDTADAELRADIEKKIEDVTSDSKQFVRKKGKWEEFSTTINVSNIPSSPVRGQIYLTSGNEIVIGI